MPNFELSGNEIGFPCLADLADIESSNAIAVILVRIVSNEQMLSAVSTLRPPVERGPPKYNLRQL